MPFSVLSSVEFRLPVRADCSIAEADPHHPREGGLTHFGKVNVLNYLLRHYIIYRILRLQCRHSVSTSCVCSLYVLFRVLLKQAMRESFACRLFTALHNYLYAVLAHFPPFEFSFLPIAFSLCCFLVILFGERARVDCRVSSLGKQNKWRR